MTPSFFQQPARVRLRPRDDPAHGLQIHPRRAHSRRRSPLPLRAPALPRGAPRRFPNPRLPFRTNLAYRPTVLLTPSQVHAVLALSFPAAARRFPSCSRGVWDFPATQQPGQPDSSPGAFVSRSKPRAPILSFSMMFLHGALAARDWSCCSFLLPVFSLRRIFSWPWPESTANARTIHRRRAERRKFAHESAASLSNAKWPLALRGNRQPP